MATNNAMNRAKIGATWLIVLGFLAFAGWQAYQFIIYQSVPRVSVTIKDVVYNAQVPANEAERIQGLSGTKPLGKNDAMLFVFPYDDNWGIWMKDMNYPIDIVWLGNDKRIVYMVKSADPSSYPATTFRPDRPARYVVELSAGTITANNIKINDMAAFDLDSLRGRIDT